MNSAKLGVLEILAQNPKGSQSISDIVRALKRSRGRAYYKNVYDTIKSLEEEGVISVKSAGRTSLISLDFGNPETILNLSIIEIEKKRSFLKEESDESGIVRSLEAIGGLAILMRPRETLKLNLLGVLYIAEEGYTRMLSELDKLGKKHNCRIIPLILTSKEFKDKLESAESNMIKDALRDCIILSNPESFWRLMENAAVKDVGMLEKIEDIREGELRYNLARFGYTGFGDEKLKGGKISIEGIIIACLLKKDARLTEAVPVLLAKNAVNYRLLLYLATKYGLAGMMGFLMETSAGISKKREIREALALFELYRKPIKSNAGNTLAKKWGVSTRNTLADFRKTMELYNAT